MRHSSELAQDRRAGGASIQSVVNSIADTGPTRLGRVLPQAQVSKYGALALQTVSNLQNGTYCVRPNAVSPSTLHDDRTAKRGPMSDTIFLLVSIHLSNGFECGSFPRFFFMLLPTSK